ncbi:MAG TPA: CvpA family protein [Bacteroidales bacterium]|nr:CvpA family protein [Bacteroidales bacterium]
MNIIDIIILIPIAFYAYKGFTKGFFVSIAMLAGLLFGFYAAINFSEYMADFLTQKMNLAGNNIRFIAYITTFVLVVVLVYLLGQFLSKVAKTAGLGLVNRLSGAALGIVKALIIVSTFLLLLAKIDPKAHLVSQKTRDESISFKPVLSIAPAIYPILKKYSDRVLELMKDKSENTGEPMTNTQ